MVRLERSPVKRACRGPGAIQVGAASRDRISVLGAVRLSGLSARRDHHRGIQVWRQASIRSVRRIRGLDRIRRFVVSWHMLNHLKANNRNWAQRKVAADPGFFRRLEDQQAPEYLWIGCSDSRVPATEIVDLDPGELFVHRNVANLAPPQDANYLSVLQFAVDVIRVKHIIVVGHYGCGGIAAAVDGQRRGLVDHWLHPIREVFADNREALEAIPDLRARLNRLCELNVIRQVHNVASDVFVQDAWARGQDLHVHGWVYTLSNGLITDLNVTVDKSMDPSLPH